MIAADTYVRTSVLVTAERGATGRSFTCGTPCGLRDLIVADYSAYPRVTGGGPETGEPGHRDRP